MNDFDIVLRVRDEVIKLEKSGFDKLEVKVWSGMSAVDIDIAKLEADDVIERKLEQFRNHFNNPDLFKTFVWYLQQKYRANIMKFCKDHPYDF